MAWAQHDDSPVRILEASALGSVANKLSFAAGAANGQVLIENGRVYVLCADETALELKQVQPAGKNPMAAQDWARGLKIAPVLN
jgi:methionyl-tRNA formyltransferase